MAVGTITSSRGYLTQQLTTLSRTLTEKTAQLATGKVSTTYGGVGNQRQLDLELSQKVKRIEAYQETITMSRLHIKTLNLNLERLEKLRIQAKDAMDLNNFELQADGQTSTQATAEILLTEAISLLNSEVGGHFLFGGSDASKNPVLQMQQILDGVDGKAGLKQVLSEFWQANAGAGQNGRMTVSAQNTTYSGGGAPLTSSFTVSEDGAHTFGFDIKAVTTNMANVTLTPPTGADPDSFGIELTGQPVPGQKISIELGLPPTGARTTRVELTVAASGNAPNTFRVGADLEQTTTNLRNAVMAALTEEAKTTLRGASDEWAANSFFDTFGGTPPMRVAGPPFNTATTLVDGSATTTSWYVGENTATTDPRQDKIAAVDDNLRLGYGVRANERGLANVVKTLSTFIAADFSANTATDEKYYSALADRMKATIQPEGTARSGIVDITTEVAIAFRSIEYTAERHTTLKSGYLGTIAEIEGIDKETLAVEIVQLQTMLEASYRASSIAMKMSLADYL
ncbi:flagellar protein [Pannonibacter tanglangensis]|uniref:Flagellar protein n=1 Tax=Pannonibacter tanglangensis TaxID=2750084 RepID=A0ABW9ZHK5_9HYPH|nr:flagellar protein [Pannonibacter sp. XCT-34]NBN63523.1 flagellar protein [Pannonibacter sp. XCT-34]